MLLYIHTHRIRLHGVHRKKALRRTTWHAQLKMSADLLLDVPSSDGKRKSISLMVEDIYRENPDLPDFTGDHGLVAV